MSCEKVQLNSSVGKKMYTACEKIARNFCKIISVKLYGRKSTEKLVINLDDVKQKIFDTFSNIT